MIIPNPITVPLTIAESEQQVEMAVSSDLEEVSLQLETSVQISGGGTIEALSVFENGVYEAPEGVSYNPVTVLVEASGTLNITENGTYDVGDYESAEVLVPGIQIPDGYAYYNGYLIPEVPIVEGYPYFFIRLNSQTEMYDAVFGTSRWYSASSATLDNWRLTFANQSTVLSRVYSIPIDLSVEEWEEGTASANVYATSNDRKVIFSNEDITINNGTNILCKKGFALSY